jgi:transposase-like protein
MTTKTRPQFNPEFKVEYAQLVLDQRYSIREAADAMNVGRPERASLNLRG